MQLAAREALAQLVEKPESVERQGLFQSLLKGTSGLTPGEGDHFLLQYLLGKKANPLCVMLEQMKLCVDRSVEGVSERPGGWRLFVGRVLGVVTTGFFFG